jgi:hypothetical protein
MNYVTTKPAQQFSHDFYVVDLRNIRDRGRTFGQQSCSHEFEHGVLGAGHFDDPLEARPALNPKDFHVLIVRARGLKVP